MHEAAAEEIAPDAIDDVAGEVFVLGAGEPICEGEAAVREVVERFGFTVERRGRKRTQEARVVYVACLLGIDDELSGAVAIFETDASEEVGELVVLLLRPFLERMIVTTRAGKALAEEGLRDVFAEIDHVLVLDEVVERAVFAGGAGSSEDVAGELVPGLVFLHRIANPVVKGPHVVGAELARTDEQEVAPFVGPVVGELVALH